LTCYVYDATGTLIAQKSTKVHAVAQETASVSLLPFGDSLTNHCVWEAELMNINSHITCVGSRSRTVQNASEQSVTVYDEGRAGFTTGDYLAGFAYTGTSDTGGDETSHNRWWNPSTEKFSMSYYMSNYFPSGQTAPNCMTFFLGMNDLMSTNTISNIIANIKTMIDDIRSYSGTIKIVIIAPQIRFLGEISTDEQIRFINFAEALETLAESYSDVCYLPLLIGMDSMNNYNMTDVTINTRNPEIQQRCGDITHPAKYGYWQFADWVDGAISYLFSE
jgi:hypothetical protein